MYYEDKRIDILTALLAAHGVRKIVACPGSRNAPLVNNFCESGLYEMFPVTDERSAGFYALGMSQASGEPVAVCVTSGSALLNVAPAVVEAYYQHIPLVVISADRPQEWVGQLAGQTMVQDGVMSNYVRKSINMTAAFDDEWFSTRIVNEALLACDGRWPVHINIPLRNPSEYRMTEKHSLTDVRAVMSVDCGVNTDILKEKIVDPLLQAKRPMMIIGQTRLDAVTDRMLKTISSRVVVLSEPLTSAYARYFEPVVNMMDSNPALRPDFVVYMGGNMVCRSMIAKFAALDAAEFWEIDVDGEIHDTYKRLNGIVKADVVDFISVLHDSLSDDRESSEFVGKWNQMLSETQAEYQCREMKFSAGAVVKYFEEQLEDMFYGYEVHYANSSSVRHACRYVSGHSIWCNRGVNGIDGCLSTAAGFSVVSDSVVFCVIGDLSFFYDQNALWNTNLKGNLRIILLNNGGGYIFNKVKGLEQCSARDTIVSAAHTTDARGICTQNDVGYISARNIEEMQIGIVTLMTSETSRPMLLEVKL